MQFLSSQTALASSACTLPTLRRNAHVAKTWASVGRRTRASPESDRHDAPADFCAPAVRMHRRWCATVPQPTQSMSGDGVEAARQPERAATARCSNRLAFRPCSFRLAARTAPALPSLPRMRACKQASLTRVDERKRTRARRERCICSRIRVRFSCNLTPFERRFACSACQTRPNTWRQHVGNGNLQMAHSE